MTETCAACGAAGLRRHLRVAGQAGAEGLIPSTDRFGTALSDIVRCGRCGHMQLQHLPVPERLVAAYTDAASEDYLAEEPGQRETARELLAALERYRPPGTLLDVGCWLGFLLDEARRRGWHTVGLEPSRFAAEHARGRLGLDVRGEDLFATALEDGAFDAAVLADVLEHFPHPGEALERLGALLKPAAVLVLVLPDAGSRVARALGRRWWSVIPTHVHYFTRHSLALLLERHGFSVLEITTAPKAFSVRYYLERLGGYSRPLARGLVGLAAAAGMADRIWAPDFRDRMAVLAQRAGHNGRGHGSA